MRVGVAVGFLCICAIAEGRSKPDPELFQRVDAIAKQALARPLAGISVAVARDGQVVLARGYGMANLEHSVPVTPDTPFHICSISKNILAAVVLQLAEQGKLQLDEDVTRYVPEAPTHGRRVTVRQLLNHTSGIYSFTSLPDAEENERRELTHAQVLSLIKDMPFDFEPGIAWRYNNSASYIAGMVVERVTGQEYGAWTRGRVFEPLGMKSASLCDARMIVPGLAAGYERDRGKLVNAAFLSWKLPFAAGAVCATATDLLKWQMALDVGRVLTSTSLAVMRSPTQLADGTKIDYGLGTRLGSLDGHRVVGHTGSGGGFGNVLESFPDDHLAIAVLVNTGNGAGPAIYIATAIARVLLGLPEKKVLRDLPVPREELLALAGKTYESDEGAVTNYESDGKLRFRLPGSLIEGALMRQTENTYAVEENIEVRFLMRAGSAEWAIVYQGGLMMDAKRQVPRSP